MSPRRGLRRGCNDAATGVRYEDCRVRMARGGGGRVKGPLTRVRAGLDRP